MKKRAVSLISFPERNGMTNFDWNWLFNPRSGRILLSLVSKLFRRETSVMLGQITCYDFSRIWLKQSFLCGAQFG